MIERLVEGSCVIKHSPHTIHIGHVPIIERLVEGSCVTKHITHIRHIGHVPIIERLVEGAMSKHISHIRHIRHVPVADVAVFLHNSLLPIPAGEIIINGAINSCVRQLWRE